MAPDEIANRWFKIGILFLLIQLALTAILFFAVGFASEQDRQMLNPKRQGPASKALKVLCPPEYETHQLDA